MTKKRTSSEAVKLVSKGTQFKSGAEWTGNANGRPRNVQCVTPLLRELLIGDHTEIKQRWGEKPTGAMIVALALYEKMKRGDLTAIKEGLDRVEGRVPTPMAISGDEGGTPIRITYEPVVNIKEVASIIHDKMADKPLGPAPPKLPPD